MRYDLNRVATNGPRPTNHKANHHEHHHPALLPPVPCPPARRRHGRQRQSDRLPERAHRDSYGSAPYGEHALSAYLSAKCHIAFRQRLAADVADHKKRSRAAKQAWKTRRAGAR